MEEIFTNRTTPLARCLFILLCIFIAKVLTSQQVERHDFKHRHKPYVRTFIKYHHRRTIQWDKIYADMSDSQHHSKIGKRSVEGYVGSSQESYLQSSNPNNVNVLHRKVNLKKKIIRSFQLATTTSGPTISCLYKLNSVALSATPVYDDPEPVVENDHFNVPGPISEVTLDGESVVVEQCADIRATCYTLWHQDEGGNVTVFGQGCWKSSEKAGVDSCDRCTRVTAMLPGTRFCCCTKNYCNANYTTLEEYIPTPRAATTADTTTHKPVLSHVIAISLLVLVAVLLLALIFRRIYCGKQHLDKDEMSEGVDVEKVEILLSGPDPLATGLLCVDNLTLNEHIGQGKFGSVWSGSLGSIPVAVKLYSNANTWQKEAAVYSLPHLSHPNILRYYGSDTRATLTEGGGQDHLIVLELCAKTLRRRLEDSDLSWQEFATLAHGLASALAHLHNIGVNKPCIVHRDVNSNNVLVSWDGTPRLADLGLAQVVHSRKTQPAPRRITEAGTLRYLAPEALEGALDLSGARAALCAVDVFALGLVLWEMLWRTGGAHVGAAPPYSPPYQLQGLGAPTLPQMQNLVSRNKVRPPLPKGPVTEARALKIASDTCDECWDHDAEARLTAVCVEERMAELKQMLHAQGPVIHDNNLHPHGDANASAPPDVEKNSNCMIAQSCDVTTPLLYTQPHMGRNACIERNTHTNTQTHTVELIHKSLKDITTVAPNEPRVQNVDDNCLSVARVSSHGRSQHFNENSDRLNEIRSYQRPLDYVPNDVNAIEYDNKGPKQTNLLHDVKVEKPKWGIRKFFERKLNMGVKPLETVVNLLPDHVSNASLGQSVARTKTSVVNEKLKVLPNHGRPSNLVLSPDGHFNYEGPCTLSPPNRTLSPTMLMESELNKSENKVFGFKELPSRNGDDSCPKQNQIFAVIVPKAKPCDGKDNAQVESRKASGSSDSINKSVKASLSSQSLYKSSGSAGNSESEDSTVKKRLSCDNKIITNTTNSGRSSKASINLELQYLNNERNNETDSPFDINSDCSSSEDEHLMLLSENGGSKITMQTVPRTGDAGDNRKKYQSDVLKESTQTKSDFSFSNICNSKYKNFDNEFSDPNDKENAVNGFTGDNPVYLAALNGEIEVGLKIQTKADDEDAPERGPKSPKPLLKALAIKRQHSLEQVSEIFSSTSDIHLQNPAGRVKTPGDLPIAIRKARRDRALQKGRANDSNRLSLYDDRMMFGNSL